MDAMEDIVLELRKYAEVSNDEMGELWNYLCDLWYSYQSYMSEEFLLALEKEIKDENERCKRDYLIIEREKTFTHKIRELEYRGK